MFNKILIRLTNPETLSVGTGTLTITHYELCAWKVQLPRLDLGRVGFVEIWGVKGYKNPADFFVELLGFPVYWKLEGAEFDELDSSVALGQFLIAKGYVTGEVE